MAQQDLWTSVQDCTSLMHEALTLQSACTKHPKAVDVAMWRHYKKDFDQCRRLSSRECREPVCTLQQPARNRTCHIQPFRQCIHNIRPGKHRRMCMNCYKQSPGPDSGPERWSASTRQSIRIPRMLGLMSCCMISIKLVVGLLLIRGMEKGRAIQVSSIWPHPVLLQTAGWWWTYWCPQMLEPYSKWGCVVVSES